MINRKRTTEISLAAKQTAVSMLCLAFVARHSHVEPDVGKPKPFHFDDNNNMPGHETTAAVPDGMKGDE